MKATKILGIALILTLACALLAACGNKKGDEDPLVGKWTNELMGLEFTYTFNADGTGDYYAAGTDMPFTYTAKDGQLSILFSDVDVPYETPYTIEGKTLTVKDSLGMDVTYKKK